MVNIDNSNPDPSDTSNVVQNLGFDWPSFQPGVIYADRGYEAETGSSLAGIRIFSPLPLTPFHKGVVERWFAQNLRTRTRRVRRDDLESWLYRIGCLAGV